MVTACLIREVLIRQPMVIWMLSDCASVSFDRVVVGVLQNSAKSPLFSVEERVNILEKATKDIPNVVIRPFDGLSVNFCQRESCAGNRTRSSRRY